MQRFVSADRHFRAALFVEELLHTSVTASITSQLWLCSSRSCGIKLTTGRRTTLLEKTQGSAGGGEVLEF